MDICKDKVEARTVASMVWGIKARTGGRSGKDDKDRGKDGKDIGKDGKDRGKDGKDWVHFIKISRRSTYAAKYTARDNF